MLHYFFYLDMRVKDLHLFLVWIWNGCQSFPLEPWSSPHSAPDCHYAATSANVVYLQDMKSPSELTQSPDEAASSCLPQPSKTSTLDHLTAAQQGRHDELKEWLTRRWESCDNEPPTSTSSSSGATSTTAGVKRRASCILETPADSTEDVSGGGGSRGGAAGKKGSSSKVSKNNVLLASLLATRASAEQPVVNTLSIGSIATVTPQISMLKRAPPDQLSGVAGNGGVADGRMSAGPRRRSSSSSVSSLTSVTTAGDAATSFASAGIPSQLHCYRSSGTRGQNPVLAEANLSCRDPGVDVRQSISSQELVPADVLESLCGPPATSNALLDDATLIHQLEQFLSSPDGMLTELETLLGDGYADVTSSLFTSDQTDVGGSQAAMAVDSRPPARMESQTGSHGAAGRMRGVGLLGQLLGSGLDTVAVDSSCTVSVASEAFPQRPSSLAVSSAYSHRGNEPFVVRAVIVRGLAL